MSEQFQDPDPEEKEEIDWSKINKENADRIRKDLENERLDRAVEKERGSQNLDKEAEGLEDLRDNEE